MLCEPTNESHCHELLTKKASDRRTGIRLRNTPPGDPKRLTDSTQETAQPVQHNNEPDSQSSVKAIIRGFIISAICTIYHYVTIWFVKYRLRYLLRICLTSSILTYLVRFLPHEDTSILTHNVNPQRNLLCFLLTLLFFRHYWNTPDDTEKICFSTSIGTLMIDFLPFEDAPILINILTVRHYIFHITILMVVVRFFWGLPSNTVLVCAGFNHLKPMASYRRTTVKELSTEFLKYRDPGQLNPVYVNGWIPIIESINVLKGLTATAVAIGYKFCIYRGEDGRVRVLDAYCPHMGADLSAGGRVVGNQIECPFHGWKFCGDSGKCTEIPYSSKVPGRAKTKIWTSCERNGTIFVWHHSEGDPPSWELPSIPQIENGKWIHRGRSELTTYCHIQEIPENGADINHLPHVHSGFVGLGPSLVSGFSSLVQHKWKPQWEPDKEHPHKARGNIQQQLYVSKFKVPWTHIDVDVEQIGPATVHLHLKTKTGRGVMLQYITSEGPMKQRIIHNFYTEPRFSHALASFLMWGETVMIQRDIEVWNNKKFLNSPILVKEDKLIAMFRRWYSKFYSEHSPTLQEARQRTLEW